MYRLKHLETDFIKFINEVSDEKKKVEPEKSEIAYLKKPNTEEEIDYEQTSDDEEGILKKIDALKGIKEKTIKEYYDLLLQKYR